MKRTGSSSKLRNCTSVILALNKPLKSFMVYFYFTVGLSLRRTSNLGLSRALLYCRQTWETDYNATEYEYWGLTEWELRRKSVLGLSKSTPILVDDYLFKFLTWFGPKKPKNKCSSFKCKDKYRWSIELDNKVILPSRDFNRLCQEKNALT